MADNFLVSIDGGFAAKHHFPLYEGGETLSGLGLTFTRTGHYLLTGEVRHRAPYDPRVIILANSPRPGSVELDLLSLITGPAPTSLIGQITLSVGASTIFGFGLYIIRRIIGKAPKLPPEDLLELVDSRPGDIDALTSANTSSVRRAHSIIGNGATVITINGNNNEVILNRETKDYVNTTIQSDEVEFVEGSVGWLNANTRNGGLFVKAHGRVIPFDLHKDVGDESLDVLLTSLRNYTLGRVEDATISVRILASTAIDGRIKRYLLLDAEEFPSGDQPL